MPNVYQLHINLMYANPPIWRRIRVSEEASLKDLHYILQTAMNWENSHMYEFEIDGKFFEANPGEDLFGQMFVMTDDEDFENGDIETKLKDLKLQEKKKFMYTYDMGDNWEHEITVEKIVASDEKKVYPQCLDGERNGPLDDSGGVPGYEEMINALKDPNHPEHEDMKEWAGDDFDPEYFDKETINETLKEMKDEGVTS
jgi:hypothetical protein